MPGGREKREKIGRVGRSDVKLFLNTIKCQRHDTNFMNLNYLLPCRCDRLSMPFFTTCQKIAIIHMKKVRGLANRERKASLDTERK